MLIIAATGRSRFDAARVGRLTAVAVQSVPLLHAGSRAKIESLMQWPLCSDCASIDT